MSYIPVAPTSDDRSSRGAVPLVLRNVQIEKAPTQSGKGQGYFLSPTPGFTSRVTPSSGQLCRGLYAQPGVQSGKLYGIFGEQLYEIDSAWTATAKGAVVGYKRALFDGLREKLLIVADGEFYVFDAGTLTAVTDTDLSPDLYTLAVLAQRAITSSEGTDQIEWSAVLDATDWPSDAFLTSEIKPDPVKALVVVGDELYALNEVGTQLYRAIGGADADSFDTFAGMTIDKGCIARDTAVRVDASLYWLSDERVLMRAAGSQAQRVINRDMEIALQAMTLEEVSSCQAFTYADGSKLFYVLRPPVGGRAWAFNVADETWAELTTWQADEYRYAFYAYANDRHVVSGPDSDTIYTMEHGVYADAGATIERTIMLHLPVPRDTVIGSIGFDIKTFGQPLSGQGSDPELMVTFYRDGGSVESTAIGIERTVKLGTAGQYDKRPTLWRFGRVGSDGFLLKLRITDPVGFAIYGVWINEGRA